MPGTDQSTRDGVPLSYVLRRIYSDVDDLAAEARQWDVDFRQLSRGRFHGELLQFAAGNVHVSEARFRRALNQKGTPPRGMRTIAIPAHRDMRLQWRGKSVDGDSLMLFPRGAELASVSGSDFHIFTCSFPEELLAAVSETLELGEIDALSGGAEALRIGDAAIDQLRGCLTRICQLVRQGNTESHHPAVAESLTDSLPKRLITTIANRREVCPAAIRPRRQAALGRAEAYIEHHGAVNVRVSDICQAAGVSERTLQAAFLQKFGVGPKEFLNGLRLIGARRQLRTADARQIRVTEIANAWGFWHMGQFAADYRKRFDELPSETLRRSAC